MHISITRYKGRLVLKTALTCQNMDDLSSLFICLILKVFLKPGGKCHMPIKKAKVVAVSDHIIFTQNQCPGSGERTATGGAVV